MFFNNYSKFGKGVNKRLLPEFVKLMEKNRKVYDKTV